MATMKQIAQLAGVSRGTVDRVLNNRGIVNEKTARKVREIADSLQYTPSKAARSLAALKRNIRLTYIMPDPDSNHFFLDVEAGVRKKAEDLQEYGVEVDILHTDLVNPESQQTLLQQAVDNGSSGIIIAGCNSQPIADTLQEIISQGIPVVTANTDISNCGRIAYVGSDGFRCGETAAGMLRMLTQGKAKVGIIIGSRNILGHAERVSGFRTNISQKAPGMEIVKVVENLDDDFESYAITQALMQEHPEINALFFTGGGSFGACRAVESLKPEKLPAIVCFDCTRENRKMMERGVISALICQHPEVQGSMPLEILFNLIALGIHPESEYHYTDIEIIIPECLP